MLNLRAYYRVVFPIGARPWLIVGDQMYPVLDCSERGVRVQMEIARRPGVDRVLKGRIRFPTRDEVEIVGTVHRHTPEGVALQLAGRGISFHTMVRIQIYLRRRFWLADPDPGEPDLGRPALGR